MKIELWLYKIWSRFLTLLGDIMLCTTPPRTKAKQILEAVRLAKRGDIILRGYNYYLDSYFIGGEYTHSGLVVENDTQMIDSVAEGVRLNNIIDFIKDTDRFMIIRPFYKSEDDIDKAIVAAIGFLNTPYDFIFKDGKDAVYCHELCAECLKYAGIEIKKSTKKLLFIKREVYQAKDLINGSEIIYVFWFKRGL